MKLGGTPTYPLVFSWNDASKKGVSNSNIVHRGKDRLLSKYDPKKLIRELTCKYILAFSPISYGLMATTF